MMRSIFPTLGLALAMAMASLTAVAGAGAHTRVAGSGSRTSAQERAEVVTRYCVTATAIG